MNRRSDLALAALLALFFTIAYVRAWNHFHPRLHQCSFGSLAGEQVGAYEKWVRRNHTLHHLQKGAGKGNNNILLPLADHLLGKYRVCVDHAGFLSAKQGQQLSPSERALSDAMKARRPLPYQTHFCYYPGGQTGFTRIL